MRWFPEIRFSGIGGKILLLSLLGGIGMAGIAGVNGLLAHRVELEMSVGQHADRVTSQLLSMMLMEQEFINTSDQGVLGGRAELVLGVKKECISIREKSDDSLIQTQIAGIDASLKEHDALFQEMSANLGKTNSAKKEINEIIQNLQKAIESIIHDIDQEEVRLNMGGGDLPVTISNIRSELKTYLGLWYVKEQNLQDLLLFGRVDEYKSRETELAGKIKLQGSNLRTLFVASKDAKLIERWQEAIKSAPRIEELGAVLVQHWQANRDLMVKLKENASSVQQAAQLITKMTNETISGRMAIAQSFEVGAVVLGLALLCILCFFIYRSVTRSLKQAIESLTSSSDRVADASAQIVTASRTLAEGAADQAASLEETSASLEEMASMTAQNANNAGEADGLMKEANSVVADATSSMSELTRSMAEISRASEETSKIIKTIDEIAFQTNLLALNAAVEAARAGEAGAGFAVVADEVRNLATRAAGAAKSTSDLIEGTVKKVKDGSNLVSRTNTAFGEVARSVAKAGGLVGEISAASSEQAHGITQINTAVASMDKVVQQNAAGAEQSASASSEMSTEAEKVRDYVQTLEALVGGSGVQPGKKQGSQAHENDRAVVPASSPVKAKSMDKINVKQKSREQGPAGKAVAREAKAEELIPFDEDVSTMF